MIIFILFCIPLFYLSYKKYNPKKKVISVDKLGIVFNLISLFLNEHVSDIHKNNYKNTFDNIIMRINLFNKDNKEFESLYIFENYIWKYLSQAKYYNSHKIFLNIVINIINGDLNIAFYYFIINIYKIPLIIYNIYKDSSSSKEKFLANLGLLETIVKAYQISLIMNVDLEIVIKKIRLFRNIPIFDKKSKNKMITRQVLYPMRGSEICPYMNYIKKSQIINVKLNYSVLIIKKNIMISLEQYSCKECNDKSCVVYKGKKGIIKHLKDCNFWKDDNYWKNKYPKEREIII